MLPTLTIPWPNKLRKSAKSNKFKNNVSEPKIENSLRFVDLQVFITQKFENEAKG